MVIKNKSKDELSPAEAEFGDDLGNFHGSNIVVIEFLSFCSLGRFTRHVVKTLATQELGIVSAVNGPRELVKDL